jgi:tetratricopeptide (TPR) repeat protein/tRNA A-37 threonylcarbamoyl transferase component Bud32
MIGKTISHYKIVEKLGEGGMGTVYKARDLDLDRTVALKFLKHATLSSEDERKRFQREAQAAASLDHPNICTIYEIGEADGVVFIAMAHVEGAGLDERLDSGPLPLKQAVDIAVQVAEGLHAAHEREIIHRDVKGANIIVDDKGRAKITDFGLALREGESRLTKSGLTVGTSVFMSPEQCCGEPVDQRTDIWSLGVVLYEMITARLPFVAEHDTAILYAILNTDPEPITALRSGVPMELERVVNKALSKDPEERYQHADELAADLKRLQKEIESSTGSKAAAGTGQSRARLKGPAPWIALAAIAAVIAAVIVFYPSQTVPFTERGWMIIANFENETGEEVFDDIVSEALAIDIQQSKHVNVFSHQRIDQALRRMGRDTHEFLDEKTAREVAQREGVSAVLAGSVNRVGESYILTARIVIPETGDAVRTVRTEAEDLGNVLDAIDDLSKQVRRDLGESLPSIWRHDKPLALVTTNSLRALTYYTKATKHVRAARWSDAVPLLQQAIGEDSSFAMAYSKLGVIYSNMRDTELAMKYSEIAKTSAENVTDRERYYIEALYFEERGKTKRAIDSYKLLVEVYPDDFIGHNNLSFLLQYDYEYEDALKYAQAAKRIAPDAWYPHHNLSGIYAGLGEYELAIENAKKAQSINPEGYWSYIVLAWVYCCQGDPAAGQKELNRLPPDDEDWRSLSLLYLACLRRACGDDEAALSYLQQGILNDDLAGRVQSQSRKWIVVADIKRIGGDGEGALDALRTAGQLSWSVGNMTHLGAGYAAAGNWGEAEAILAELEEPWEWEKTANDLALIERYKGDLAMARGDYEGAVQDLNISTGHREDLVTRYRLGRALRLTGEYDRAIKEFEMIDGKRYGAFFDAAPWIWPLSLYELGLAHEAAGDSRAAAESFERFLDLWSDADPNRDEVLDARLRLESLQ